MSGWWQTLYLGLLPSMRSTLQAMSPGPTGILEEGFFLMWPGWIISYSKHFLPFSSLLTYCNINPEMRKRKPSFHATLFFCWNLIKFKRALTRLSQGGTESLPGTSPVSLSWLVIHTWAYLLHPVPYTGRRKRLSRGSRAPQDYLYPAVAIPQLYGNSSRRQTMSLISNRLLNCLILSLNETLNTSTVLRALTYLSSCLSF